jgi:hypothetical protein
MKTLILATLFLAIFTVPSFCQKDEFAVDVQLKNHVFSAATPYVSVYLSVANVSENEQSIIDYTCSSDPRWKVDNSSFGIPKPYCRNDAMKCRVLKSGESLKVPLPIPVYRVKPDQMETGDAVIKFGFTAFFCQGSTGTGDLKILKEKTYWSDPITVQVQ